MLVFDGSCTFGSGQSSSRYTVSCSERYSSSYIQSATLEGEESIYTGAVQPTVLTVKTRSGRIPYFFKQGRRNIENTLNNAFSSYGGPFNNLYQSLLSELLSKYGSRCKLTASRYETITSCFSRKSGEGVILVGRGAGPTPYTIKRCWNGEYDCESPIDLTKSSGRISAENVVDAMYSGSP